MKRVKVYVIEFWKISDISSSYQCLFNASCWAQSNVSDICSFIWDASKNFPSPARSPQGGKKLNMEWLLSSRLTWIKQRYRRFHFLNEDFPNTQHWPQYFRFTGLSMRTAIRMRKSSVTPLAFCMRNHSGCFTDRQVGFRITCGEGCDHIWICFFKLWRKILNLKLESL